VTGGGLAAGATDGSAAAGGNVAAGAAAVATAVVPLPPATRAIPVPRRRDICLRRRQWRRSAGAPDAAAARAHGRLARRDRSIIVAPLPRHRGVVDRGHSFRAATSAAPPPRHRCRTAAAVPPPPRPLPLPHWSL